jgi:hypothetical protein
VPDDMSTRLRRSARTHAGTMRYSTPAGGIHLVWTAHTSRVQKPAYRT